MRWGYRLGLAALCAVWSSALGFASVGTEAAAFLEIPVGARPAALGGAYSALAADAYAPTWNPAGLGFLTALEISGQHVDYLDSIHYEYLSGVFPLNKEKTSAIGVAGQYLGSGDITGTDGSGNITGSFNTSYGAYSVSYGHRIGESLSLGLTGKIIEAKIADVGAQAFAGDLGALYKISDRLTLATTLTNFGSKLTFLNDGGTLPEAAHVGVAWKPIQQVSLSAEDAYEPGGLNSGHFGVEWSPLYFMALRAGYHTDTLKELDALAGFSTGIGLRCWGQEFAYAWEPYGDLGNTQYFSLLIRLGADEEARKNLIQYQTIHNQTVRKHSGDGPQDGEYQQLMQLLNSDETGHRVTEKSNDQDVTR